MIPPKREQLARCSVPLDYRPRALTALARAGEALHGTMPVAIVAANDPQWTSVLGLLRSL